MTQPAATPQTAAASSSPTASQQVVKTLQEARGRGLEPAAMVALIMQLSGKTPDAGTTGASSTGATPSTVPQGLLDTHDGATDELPGVGQQSPTL